MGKLHGTRLAVAKFLLIIVVMQIYHVIAEKHVNNHDNKLIRHRRQTADLLLNEHLARHSSGQRGTYVLPDILRQNGKKRMAPSATNAIWPRIDYPDNDLYLEPEVYVKKW